MEAAGKTVKRTYCHEENDEDLKKDIWDKTYTKAYALATSCNTDKHSRSENFEAVKAEYIAALDPEVAEAKKGLIDRYYHAVEKEAMDEGRGSCQLRMGKIGRCIIPFRC